MAKLTPGQIYQAARAAGFSATAAVMATAVALAESGGDAAAVGDQSLANATWGPSVGLWQVRTLKAKTGTGDLRDIAALTGDVATQARAAYSISNGGTDWTPWSVYNSGAYQAFMGQAAGSSGGDSGSTAGAGVQPAGLGGDAIRGYAEGLLAESLKPARNVAVLVAVVGLGLALVGAGIWRAVEPARDAVRSKATDAAMLVV